MKWFKHDTTAHSNLKMQMLISKFGLKGYGYYWCLVELAASGGTEYRVGAEKEWKFYFKKLLEIETEIQNEILEYLAETRLIDKKSLIKGDLYIPTLEERSDDYTKRVRRVYEQSTDNVPLEEIRRDKKRLEEDKKKKLVDKSTVDLNKHLGKFPKADYSIITESYKKIKGVEPKGKEWLPILKEIKLMFQSGRTPPQIVKAMEVCNSLYDDWAMSTIRMKIADVVSGKLGVKTKQGESSLEIKSIKQR